MATVTKEKTKFKTFDVKNGRLDYPFSYNDDETKALHQKLNYAPSITLQDLHRVALWKTNQVLSVSSETLQKLTEISLDKNLTIHSPLAAEVLELLVDSAGIGYPMASSNLKFIRPDVFPIIDIRAYRALEGKKLYYSMYTTKLYIDYAEKLVNLAQERGIEFQYVDEQLYAFDKAENGNL
jgi:thermostable 8-oxoguanine DNA glycosylase